MTFLAAANLVSCDSAYDYKHFKINEVRKTELLIEAEKRYSHNFVERIRRMLNSDELLRPSFGMDMGRNSQIGNSPLNV